MKFLGSAVVVVLLSACQAHGPSELDLWTQRVDQIKVGMRREEVEKILKVPRYGYGPSTTITGGAQGCVYDVSTEYSVTVFYDYTGATRDGAGVALSTSSPDNRVIGPAVLNHRNQSEGVQPTD